MNIFECDVTVVPNSQMKLNVGSYYYFGDLCYVFGDSDWQAICDIIGGEYDFCIEDNTEIKLKNGFIPQKISLASTDCGDVCIKQKNYHLWIWCNLMEVHQLILAQSVL